MNTSIPKSVPIKYASRIEYWDDERSAGNSLLVTLKAGWRFDSEGEHVRGFDTQREATAEVSTTRPCECSKCAKAADPG